MARAGAHLLSRLVSLVAALSPVCPLASAADAPQASCLRPRRATVTLLKALAPLWLPGLHHDTSFASSETATRDARHGELCVSPSPPPGPAPGASPPPRCDGETLVRQQDKQPWAREPQQAPLPRCTRGSTSRAVLVPVVSGSRPPSPALETSRSAKPKGCLSARPPMSCRAAAMQAYPRLSLRTWEVWCWKVLRRQRIARGFLHPLGPQFPHLQSAGDNSSCPRVLVSDYMRYYA